MPDHATKRCTKCGEVKPPSDFYVRRKSADGRDYRCKECALELVREYVTSNAAAIIERRRRRRQERRDVIRAQDRRFRERNRAARAAQERERRARFRTQVFDHYGWTCACCGSIERLTLDHVNGDGREHREELFGDPRIGSARFYRWVIGQGFPADLATLCQPCNSSKRSGERCRLDHEMRPDG
jgi:hypothetical protein